MPQDLGDDLDVDAGGQGQRGEGVAEVVKADRRQPRALQQAQEEGAMDRGVALLAVGLYIGVNYPSPDGSIGPLGVLLILIGVLTVFFTIIASLYGAL